MPRLLWAAKMLVVAMAKIVFLCGVKLGVDYYD
jgi:hypothetical protein